MSNFYVYSHNGEDEWKTDINEVCDLALKWGDDTGHCQVTLFRAVISGRGDIRNRYQVVAELVAAGTHLERWEVVETFG